MDEVYKKLLQIRQSKNLKLNPNPYLKPETVLRYYQVQGVAHMFMVRRFILGDDCGLGKSPTSLAAFTAILTKDPTYKLLVVCPSSAMYQWANEIKKFCNGITSQIVESVDLKVTDEKGKRTLKSFDSREYQFKQFESNNNQVLIFNYNTMYTDFYNLKEILQKNKYMVVFDEATMFKNPKTQTFKYASELSKLGDRVYGLSGTIIKNNLIEAFSIYKVILPGLFGSEISFKRNYCIMEKIQLWKGRGIRGRVVSKIIGYKNLDHFKKTIDPYFLGRKKAQVAEELPKILTKEISLRMDAKQQAIYDDALQGFLDYNKFKNIKFLEEDLGTTNLDDDYNENLKYIDKLTALIYCQQICNSPNIIGIDAPSTKEAELLRLLDTELAGEKVVIYTRFKKMIDRLEILVNKAGVVCTKITGDIDNRDREERKIRFNTSKDCNIIFINAAAKEAINLQSSGYLIFYDLPFSYGDFLQIIGRIHRIGSTKESIMLIYLMCKGTIDEKVYKILTSKKELFDKILGDSAEGAIVPKDVTVINTLFDEMIFDAKTK